MIVRKDEVLRYLGYRDQPISDSLNALILSVIAETSDLVRPNYTYKKFTIELADNKVNLLATSYCLLGSDIVKHLRNSDYCVILATTIGNPIEQRIKYYNKFDLTKSLVLDACGSVAIESYTDQVQELISAEADELGYGITYRYSPGYGDLPITSQQAVARLLETEKKIGLTVTADNILLPRKSVTAIIGYQNKGIVNQIQECDSCSSRKFCKFAKEGGYCGR